MMPTVPIFSDTKCFTTKDFVLCWYQYNLSEKHSTFCEEFKWRSNGSHWGKVQNV